MPRTHSRFVVPELRVGARLVLGSPAPDWAASCRVSILYPPAGDKDGFPGKGKDGTLILVLAVRQKNPRNLTDSGGLIW